MLKQLHDVSKRYSGTALLNRRSVHVSVIRLNQTLKKINGITSSQSGRYILGLHTPQKLLKKSAKVSNFNALKGLLTLTIKTKNPKSCFF